MKSPPFPPTADMKSTHVLLCFVVYCKTVELSKNTVNIAISFSYASYYLTKLVKIPLFKRVGYK